MKHKLLWQYEIPYQISTALLHEAIAGFYTKFQVKPTSVRIPVNDMIHWSNSFNYGHSFQLLEKDKEYATYMMTIMGPVMIDILEEADEQTHIGKTIVSTNGNAVSFIVVENDLVDKQFEKVFLEDKNG